MLEGKLRDLEGQKDAADNSLLTAALDNHTTQVRRALQELSDHNTEDFILCSQA